MKRRNFLAGLLAGLALAVVPITTAAEDTHSFLDHYGSQQPEKIMYSVKDRSVELWYPNGTYHENGEQWYTVEHLKFKNLSVSSDICVHTNLLGQNYWRSSKVAVTVDSREFYPKGVWIVNDIDDIDKNLSSFKYNSTANFSVGCSPMKNNRIGMLSSFKLTTPCYSTAASI